MRGAYHLADKISNTFCSFPLIIFLAIILILPLDTEAGAIANARGFSVAPSDAPHTTKVTEI